MRHAIGLGVVLVLVSTGESLAAANQGCAQGLWTPTGSMSTPRSGHAAALLPSGKVLVAGGLGPGDVVSGTAEVYDPATGTWSRTGSMSIPHGGFFPRSHTLTLLATGKVLVVGGLQETPQGLLTTAEL